MLFCDPFFLCFLMLGLCFCVVGWFCVFLCGCGCCGELVGGFGEVCIWLLYVCCFCGVICLFLIKYS